ncbi:MAG: hypothetical protein MUF04_12680 [Akkermansiaceae bacterium]|jgi:hypothetical protein|nr:hypothetical protein [Akkermansiaceae bacterium]
MNSSHLVVFIILIASLASCTTVVRPVPVASPAFGTAVTTLPAGHRVVVHSGLRYYVCGGTYYRHLHGRYVVVRPPAATPSRVVVRRGPLFPRRTIIVR